MDQVLFWKLSDGILPFFGQRANGKSRVAIALLVLLGAIRWSFAGHRVVFAVDTSSPHDGFSQGRGLPM
jgi:hypothetical protein